MIWGAILCLMYSSVEAEPRRAKPPKNGLRMDAIASGDGWWCFTALTDHGTSSSCTRNEARCVIDADEREAMKGVTGVSKCTFQAKAATVTYYLKLHDQFASMSFASFDHCKELHQWIVNDMRNDISQASQCVAVGAIKPSAAKSIAQLGRYVDDLCRCKTLQCAKSVLERLVASAQPLGTMSKTQEQNKNALLSRLETCSSRISFDAQLDDMEGLTDKLCACADADCADAVGAETQALLAGAQLSGAPSAEHVARAQSILDKTVACRKALHLPTDDSDD